MEMYLGLNEYYRSIFGRKTAKISLDGGFSCPNRDGTLDRRGCIFCSVGGSGDFSEDASLSIAEQITLGKAQTLKKWSNACYIAYFQAFTNTYAPVDILREKYEAAIDQPDVVGLSIATRPDCLGDEVLELLEEISHKTKLWVELGLQTANENTAALIRRCYKNQAFKDAVNALNKRNIPVVSHVIVGLPNEDERDVLATIDLINSLPVQGVKLQLLHVLKNTDMEEMYIRGEYTPLTKDEYLSVLCSAIARLRPDIVIHRLTGDGDREQLTAPLWSLNKRDVLNSLHKKMRNENIFQGKEFH